MTVGIPSRVSLSNPSVFVLFGYLESLTNLKFDKTNQRGGFQNRAAERNLDRRIAARLAARLAARFNSHPG